MSDRATIVSLLPMDLMEVKTGLIPSRYFIPKAEDGKFSITHIKPAAFDVEIPLTGKDGGMSTIRVPTPSSVLAESLVFDFVDSQLGINREEESIPGIFWLYEALSPIDVLTKHSDKIAEYNDKQNRWFKSLIMIADDDWAQSRRHNTISDLQRIAARRLKWDREWLVDETKIKESATVSCPACMTQVHSEAAICATCTFILNPKAYASMGFAKNLNPSVINKELEALAKK